MNQRWSIDKLVKKKKYEEKFRKFIKSFSLTDPHSYEDLFFILKSTTFNKDYYFEKVDSKVELFHASPDNNFEWDQENTETPDLIVKVILPFICIDMHAQDFSTITNGAYKSYRHDLTKFDPTFFDLKPVNNGTRSGIVIDSNLKFKILNGSFLHCNFRFKKRSVIINPTEADYSLTAIIDEESEKVLAVTLRNKDGYFNGFNGLPFDFDTSLNMLTENDKTKIREIMHYNEIDKGLFAAEATSVSSVKRIFKRLNSWQDYDLLSDFPELSFNIPFVLFRIIADNGKYYSIRFLPGFNRLNFNTDVKNSYEVENRSLGFIPNFKLLEKRSKTKVGKNFNTRNHYVQVSNVTTEIDRDNFWQTKKQVEKLDHEIIIEF
ncbi:tail fiber protein [Carp edema virus]|nr:tail fiber protein [Carp edema virus]